MNQVKGNPITGGRTPQRRPFVLANQAETSSTAQRQIRQPDIPQQDSQLRVPAPTNGSYRSASDLSGFARQGLQYGGTGRAVSVREMSDPNFGAVGYERGATKPRFKTGNSIISGSPTRNNRAVIGNGNQPSAKAVSASMRKIGLDKAYEEFKRYGG